MGVDHRDVYLPRRNPKAPAQFECHSRSATNGLQTNGEASDRNPA